MSQLQSHARSSTMVPWLFALSLSLLSIAYPLWGQSSSIRSITISAQVVKGSMVYKLNGNTVKDRPDNSLIKKLTDLARARGTSVPVILIVDTHAPFSEVGKLETALDKVGFAEDVTVYVANFVNKTMNQIHWDSTSKAIP